VRQHLKEQIELDVKLAQDALRSAGREVAREGWNWRRTR
jgi:hypothetical protein